MWGLPALEEQKTTLLPSGEKEGEVSVAQLLVRRVLPEPSRFIR